MFNIMWKEHELVLLPTDKAENALIKSISALNLHGLDKLHYSNQYLTQEYLSHINCKPYHLYILSNDKINDDDWSYDRMMKSIGQRNNVYSSKIIATTDKLVIKNMQDSNGVREIDFDLLVSKIPESFINTFVTEYNRDNVFTEVEIEYEKYALCCSKHVSSTYCAEQCKEYTEHVKLKINLDNTINIKPYKYNYTKEEVELLIMKYALDEHGVVISPSLSKWIKENL